MCGAVARTGARTGARTELSLLLLAAGLLACCGMLSWAAEPVLAIGGCDPVTYFTEGRATKGSPEYQFVRDEERYQFASTDNHATKFRPEHRACR